MLDFGNFGTSKLVLRQAWPPLRESSSKMDYECCDVCANHEECYQTCYRRLCLKSDRENGRPISLHVRCRPCHPCKGDTPKIRRMTHEELVLDAL